MRAGSTNITEGVIWKQLLKFFFPILLGTFFQQLYNTADAVIVGNFIGKAALGAVGGTTGTLINLFVGFFVGVSSGATVIISQYYGARNDTATNRALHTAIALAISSGAFIMIMGIVFAPAALRIIGTPEDIFDIALTYIRFYSSGMIFNMLYNMGAGVLRAIGDSRRPLYFLIISTFVNIALDILFVAVLHMGVAGAALATVIAQAVSAMLVLRCLVKGWTGCRLELSKVRFDRDILFSIVKIGLPAGLQSVMYGFSNIIIQANINSFGTDTIAAATAYGKIDGLFWMTMGAFGVSITTFVGQNFGAGKYDRVKRSVRVCMGMAMSCAALLSVTLLIFGKYVYRIFTPDDVVIKIGIEILWMLVPTYLTYVAIEVYSGALRGTGDALIPMLMTCGGVCVLRIVWIAIAVPLMPQLSTVYFSYPLTWSVTSILFFIYYRHGGWLRRRIKASGQSIPESMLKTK